MAYMRDHYVMCAICGLRRRRSQVCYNTDGVLVCEDTCYEGEHPQKHIYAKADKIFVTDAQPEGNDVFIETSYDERRAAL